MSRSLSWIDPAAVQQAVSRAHQPPGSRRPEPGSIAPPPPPASAIPAPPLEITNEVDLGTDDLYLPDAAEGGETLRGGSLSDRLRSLAVWVESEIGPTQWFIADEDGLGLHVAGVGERDVVASVMLARALRPLRGFFDADRVESVSLELSGGRTLFTLWCDTGLGRVALGLQDPRGLTPDNVQKLRRWLRDALEI